MSRRRKGAVPPYRLHKARNLAVVTIDGHDHYLGPFGTPASRQKYAAIIRAWSKRQEGDQPATDEPLTPHEHPSVSEVILGFLKHVQAYYKPNHGENKEAGCIADALEVLRRFHSEDGQLVEYGRTDADAFRPKDLLRVREAMVRRDWSRNYINSQINRIKRMFAWAVIEDMVPGSVHHALLTVRGLRKGAGGVRETKKVCPVPIPHFKAVLARAHPMLRAMLNFAYRTGARPGEVCALKPCYLDMAGKVWVYNVPPEANKTDVHGIERKVYIGPRARKILRPWLRDLAPHEFVFSPIRAEKIRRAEQRARRKTPLYPSHIKHQAQKQKQSPLRAKGNQYVPSAFRRAVKRLCRSAKVAEWTPNRLRHNAATRFRKKFGIEVARILLGHRKLNTTEIYAEPNAVKAMMAAREIG